MRAAAPLWAVAARAVPISAGTRTQAAASTHGAQHRLGLPRARAFPLWARFPAPFPEAFPCLSTLFQPPEQRLVPLQQNHQHPLWLATELGGLVSEKSIITENALLAAISMCDIAEGVSKGFCFSKKAK